MDLNTFVFSDQDEKLKCFVCKNYLSYFPIYLCSNSNSLCGRCVCPEGVTSFQDHAFETVCQFLKFPCRYKSEGCLEMLVPKEVPPHEETCTFRKVECILKQVDRCLWSGNLPSLLPHCKDIHSDVFLENGKFLIDLSRNEECEYLMEHDKKLLVLATKFTIETKLFQFALYSTQLQLSVLGTTCQLSFKGGNTTLLHDFATSTSEKKQFVDLYLHSLDSETELVSGKIVIDTTNKISKKKNRAQLEKTHSKFLSVLRYGVPIFNIDCSYCTEGNYCEVCTDSIDRFGVKLTQISDLINYPCKYQRVGCDYVSGYDALQTHYKFCKYESVRCVFDISCEWKGCRKDANDHILNEHQDFVLSVSNVVLELCSEDTSVVKYKFLKLSNYLFRVAYCVKGTRYMCSVQRIGYSEEVYKYEIDVVNFTGTDRRLSMSHRCLQLMSNKYTFGKFSNYCYFDKGQVDEFSETKNKISFRVQISK